MKLVIAEKPSVAQSIARVICISVSGTNVFPGRFFLWMKSIQDVIVTIICTLYKLGCMHREIDMFPQTEAIFRYVSANGD